jgi:hypothetical protein
LKTIETLDDLKEHKDEVLEKIEGIFKAASELLGEYQGEEIAPEEKAKVLAKFQDENYLFDKEVEQEMNRIDSLPGAIEYVDSFQGELDSRMQPHLEEIERKISIIMDSMMGGVMDEVGGLMEGMMEGIAQVMGEGSTFEIDEGKLDVGKKLFEVQSVEELRNSKDMIIQEIVDQLDCDLEVLKYHQKMNMPQDEMMATGHKRIRTRLELLDTELEKEFARIASLPDASEYALSVKEEIENQIKPLAEEITKLLEELKQAD